jgi:hypothetical protein
MNSTIVFLCQKMDNHKFLSSLSSVTYAYRDHKIEASYLLQIARFQSGELTLPTNFKMTEEEETCFFSFFC